MTSEQPRMPVGPDLGFLLNRATRQLRLKLAEALSDVGLTPQQAAVLIALARSDGGRLAPRAIAESVDADQPTTSGLLDRLARDGWLDSVPNPDDGRSRLVGLTAQAESSLPSIFSAAEAVSSQAVARLTSQESRELMRLLVKLTESGSASASRDAVAR